MICLCELKNYMQVQVCDYHSHKLYTINVHTSAIFCKQVLIFCASFKVGIIIDHVGRVNSSLETSTSFSNTCMSSSVSFNRNTQRKVHTHFQFKDCTIHIWMCTLHKGNTFFLKKYLPNVLCTFSMIYILRH